MNYIVSKIKNIVVSLRFSLLAIFISIFIMMMILLVSIFYLHTSDLINNASVLLLDETSDTVLQEIDSHIDPVVASVEFSIGNIQTRVVDIRDKNETMNYLMHILAKLPLAQGIYFADMNGNFIYAKKEMDGNIVTGYVDHEMKTSTNTMIKYDSLFRETQRSTSSIHYDPRQQVWFKLAMQNKKPVWTNVYSYAPKKTLLGISLVVMITHENSPLGVFGVDVRLDNLARYISQKKIGQLGEVIIFDRLGNVIIAPEFAQVDFTVEKMNQFKNLFFTTEPWIKKAFDIYRHTSQHIFLFKSAGVDYMASFNPIPLFADKGWIVGIIDPAFDFTKKVHKIELFYMLANLLIFMLGIVFVSQLVTRVVVPIKKLVKETERIKDFNLDGGSHVISRIKEVREIANAVDGMKFGLRSFQKYVPASLVRLLIKAGEDARIGGTKRELALFFSDIKDFTAITEKMESNQLLQQICEYLDAFSHIITEEQGTIDKFIGDSIMAFWGAPLYVKSPSQHAARSALVAMERLQKMNDDWSKEHQAQFITRIGLHFGEVIVGNLGSSERLNYTVLGDNVNIASRLVSANKLYGTSILTSEAVYEKIKHDFVLRLVDHVRFKGKVERIAIYELLGETTTSISFDLDTYRRLYLKAFADYQQRKWDEAIAGFKACLEINTQDTLALLFIKRCQAYKINPPEAKWDGAWQMSEK